MFCLLVNTVFPNDSVIADSLQVVRHIFEIQICHICESEHTNSELKIKKRSINYIQEIF